MTLLTGQKRMRRRFEEILALTASQGPASGAWISDSRSGLVTAGGPGGRQGQQLGMSYMSVSCGPTAHVVFLMFFLISEHARTFETERRYLDLTI